MAGPGSKKQNFLHGAAILTIGVRMAVVGFCFC